MYYSTLRLAIGKEILLLHGGSVRVVQKAEFSIGNAICIRIPFVTVNPSHNTNLKSPVTSASNSSPTTSGDSYSAHSFFQNKLVRDFSPKVSDRASVMSESSAASGGSKSFARFVQSHRKGGSEVSSISSFADPLSPSLSSPSKITKSSVLALKKFEDKSGSTNPTMHLGSKFGRNSAVRQRPGSQLSIPEQRLHDLRVLVVDDAPSNRKMLQRLLQNNKVSSELACDGQEAVSIFDSGQTEYDIMFMDHTMPVMNGVDATRLLRNKGYSNVVVAVTANSKFTQ